MTKPSPAEKIAETVGGIIEQSGELPDGSGWATMSMPLPGDHWLFDPNSEAPPMPLRLGTYHPQHEEMVAAVWTAAKYAVRAATMNGREMDFDPDALCQNMVVGLLGYHTGDGLTSLREDADWADPHPEPKRVKRIEYVT